MEQDGSGAMGYCGKVSKGHGSGGELFLDSDKGNTVDENRDGGE